MMTWLLSPLQSALSIPASDALYIYRYKGYRLPSLYRPLLSFKSGESIVPKWHQLHGRAVERWRNKHHVNVCALLISAPMTVKDVLQSLVDDNMVDCERVGTSNYYWAFPSKALHARNHKLEELQKQVSSVPSSLISN